ncbi:formimidoylglutamate deiminase [Peteryoungia desertarenae]|uniref:Formimidoylglutamate deiminase n=1 Tax=Peteryoungia desertarenae TaxID=1813451 RepID=A0ABX6QIX1_9HYPH|nr:formimidoylglutamate deiminase [Peteryoungia desertarenae]QLF68439.1 formimidoylglutamate deiminase [Peteryoungia desertarenae]
MTAIHAEFALLSGGLVSNVRVVLDGSTIAAVIPSAQREANDISVSVLLPAMSNVHSHAFQRAMAGLAETRGPGTDNFWSWRTVMYRFALSMTPDHVEAVAAQLYMEMLEAGFSRVGEFHYLHHDQDGRPYANPAEMSERIAAASMEAGIELTLLPVFYAHSNFGGQAPAEGQRRFIHDLDGFAALMEKTEILVAGLPGGVLGLAPHSLRAVTPDELSKLLHFKKGGPFHIHAAEQTKEVEDCLAWLGARPVEWLLDNAPVDQSWCLIHSTHLSENEVQRLAASGAIAGLCPITEANLGDGIFSGPSFTEQGGCFGIGTDSNVLISVHEELRMLEYAQRLGLRSRNIIAPPGGSTGLALYQHALRGGSYALGTESGIAAGAPANLISLDLSEVPWLPPAQILDHWLFADGIRISDVWIRATRLVHDSRHVKRDEIQRRFHAAMIDLMGQHGH